MKTKTIKNLEAYLVHLCSDTPYGAGRRLYKDTGCGPWTVFLKQTAAAFTRNVTLAIGLENRKLRVVHQVEDFAPRDCATENDYSKLGFRLGRKQIARTIKSYRKLITDFASKEKSNKDWRIRVHDTHPDSGTPDPRRVWVTISEDMPAVIEDVYYESAAARENIPNCIGVKIGSIVEGSEAYVDRDPLMFPFTDDAFDELVRGINKEASFYWNRDNIDSYHVRFKDKDYYIDADGEESYKDLPKSIRRKVMDFVNSEAGSLMSGSFRPDENGAMTPIPGTHAAIEQMNKSDFSF